ncbi:MAG: MFS transporter, partial [Clostridia bacterium]|nr:MFS transporter [Clostridia bacterium]
MKLNYNHTVYACYIGYITQALINNFVPLLFLTFKNAYGIPLSQISLLITANFGLQLIVDFFAARFADRIGYRNLIVTAHAFAALGLILLGVLPNVLHSPMVGIVISVMCYAIGGGLIEVLVSPIVENCPSDRKDAAMSLLHSFYCWGQMGVVLVSTVFFVVFGYENWALLAVIWASLPFCNMFFFAKVPLVEPKEQEEKTFGMRKLFGMKIFWLFVVLMLCAGASELCMSQWASAFAEDGLKVDKWLGDLAGPCLFAV